MATIPSLPILDPKLRMAEGEARDVILEQPRGKPMGDKAPAPRRIGGQLLRMGDTPDTPAGKALMQPVPKRATATALPKREQQAAPDTAPQEQSVRLRLRITKGVASVIGVRVVPGALPAPERLDYGLAYEIVNGARRIAVGTVPDVGMRRSYPDPQGRPGMQGHHLQELDTIEVNLRLPHPEFSAAAVDKLRVRLYRMKGPPPAVPIGTAPLEEQFRDLLRPVAELRGLGSKTLAPALKAELGRALFVQGGKTRG